VSLLGRRAPLVSAAAGLAWRLGGLIWVATVLLAMTAGVLTPAGAWLLKSAVDELTRPAPSLIAVAALAAATVMLQGLSLGLGSLSTLTAAAAQRRMSVAVASDLYRAVNSISGLTRFDDPDFQDSLRLAEESAERVPAALTDMLATVLQGGTVVVSFAGLLISIWPPMLALVALACLPNLAVQVSLARHSARTSEANASRFRQWLLLRGLLTDPRSVPEIRLLGSGDFFRGRLVSALRDARTAEYEVRRRIAWAQGGLTVLGAAVTAIGAIVIAMRAARHQLSVGDLVLFLAAVSGIQAALLSTLNQAMMVGSGLRLLRHYVSVVAGNAGVVPGPSLGAAGTVSIPVPPLRDGIELRDVWFRYRDSDWVLRGVTATIGFGQAVGLVGANGAGKSTMIRLLCRMYDPDRGAILWDGIDLREFDPADLRRRLAITFQDFGTYDLTAAENIGIGDLPSLADRPKIVAAAQRVGLDRVLRDLPGGYDTVLTTLFLGADGSRGVTLSGGQQQRIALARTLMRTDADLVILDEPSAGLDVDAEHQIHRQLQQFRRGRTSLLVSHRLSAVRDADLILVLHEGRISEQGTHDDLMITGGRYARLFTLQAAAYQDTRIGAEPTVLTEELERKW